MAQPGRLKQYSLRAYDQALSKGTNEYLDWVTQSLNWLIGAATPTAPGLQAVQQNIINTAATVQLPSLGSMAGSITTAITYTSTPTTITFYWDGTNGSTPLTIYRDDNSFAVLAVGNLTVTGLTASTNYFFYPFWQEAIVAADNPTGEITGVHWASFVGAAGTPAIAFSTQSVLAAQRQALRDHLPLSTAFSTTGITTPASGGGSGSGGTGGGGGTGGKRLMG